MALTLATKYRPKKISELIGQDVAVRTLTNAFSKKKLHHAYLFSGKFGCGKTSTARILAASENNDEAPSLHPDLNSKGVRSTFMGNNPDVVEFDGASKRKIDDIRDILSQTNFAPMASRMKYIIIDEAHSLTGHAAEALLKTLEEPPAHVRFVLCTTEPEKLPATIRSRCFHIHFNKVDWTVIAEHLGNICKNEEIAYQNEAMRVCAKMSDGSVRNSLVNLEKVIAYAGDEEITAEMAEAALGVSSEELYTDLIKCIIDGAGKLPDSYNIIEKIMSKGNSADLIFNNLLHHLDVMLNVIVCKGNVSSYEVTQEEAKMYSHVSNGLRPTFAGKIIEVTLPMKEHVETNIDMKTLLHQWVLNAMVERNKYFAEEKRRNQQK